MFAHLHLHANEPCVYFHGADKVANLQNFVYLGIKLSCRRI